MPVPLDEVMEATANSLRDGSGWNKRTIEERSATELASVLASMIDDWVHTLREDSDAAKDERNACLRIVSVYSRNSRIARNIAAAIRARSVPETPSSSANPNDGERLK